MGRELDEFFTSFDNFRGIQPLFIKMTFKKGWTKCVTTIRLSNKVFGALSHELTLKPTNFRNFHAAIRMPRTNYRGV